MKYVTNLLIKQTNKKIVPYGAILGFESAYEEPSTEEGFDEVRSIEWEPDFGDDPEKERLWNMWLQIDGKWSKDLPNHIIHMWYE